MNYQLPLPELLSQFVLIVRASAVVTINNSAAFNPREMRSELVKLNSSFLAKRAHESKQIGSPTTRV